MSVCKHEPRAQDYPIEKGKNKAGIIFPLFLFFLLASVGSKNMKQNECRDTASLKCSSLLLA